MKSITEFDHFSKMIEEEFSLAHPFLTLIQSLYKMHKYKPFTNQYFTERKENWYETTLACFPTDIYSASSLTNLWQKFHCSTGRTGFIISNILKA